MKRIAIVLFLVITLVSVTACGTESNAVPVTSTQEVQKQSVDVFGVVSASGVKNITLDFQAPITRIHVKEGEHVNPGKPLVSLDLAEMESTIAVKELSLTAAENDTDRVQKNTDMNKLYNDLKNTRIIYNESVNELEEQRQLFEAGSISLSDLETFKKQVDSNKKNVEDISYAIENLKNDKGSQKDQMSLDASILEADLKLLNSRLAKPYINGSEVVSDIPNGIVYDIGYVEGDIAGPQKKLLSILSLDNLEIEADIPEEFYKDIRVGSTVIITPVADKTRQYTGEISHISAKAFENTGETQIPVRIAIDESDDFLLPGFNVDVSIMIDTQS